jgi:uncharacterized secreted protein with C-terminal beta-propeller domain
MQRTEIALGAVILVLVGAAIGAGVTALGTDAPTPTVNETTAAPTAGIEAAPALLGSKENTSIGTFESADAFAAYVQRGQSLAAGGAGFQSRPVARPDVVREPRMTAMPTMTAAATNDAVAFESGAAAGGSGGDAGSQPERVSGTNVQEAGLDEPDILKTAGSTVFYSPPEMSRWEYRHDTDESRTTRVISADDPARPEVVDEIDASGRMLLDGDRVMVIEDDELHGYDVSDPENPVQVWEEDLSAEVVTARLLDGQVYLVTRTGVDLDEPCPIRPLDGASVPCTDIHRPDRQVPVDATYTALQLDMDDGSVADTTSFVGTTDNTAVYMSENALYVTYTEQANRGELRLEFLLDQDDRFPDRVTDRLEEIQGYNISGQSKRTEAERALESWYRTLDDDRRHEVRDELRNDYRDYLTDHQRALLRTGVVRIDVGDGLSVDTTGTVPGRPLNQFSMDEHEGRLRITTTVPAAGGAQSANDLYVLDNETLQQQGSVKDMGLNEEVYSVRYVGDTAYVVTFRRIDPFHVVDLSDPDDPEEVGELELPGFSSYLHPVDDDHVLGIGEEDGQVKAVLFDVSDPSNPTIDDDYILDAHWSGISESHHAFLMDRRHGVFFLPTGEGGKVFDYTDGELSLERSVDTDGQAHRAMYINDFMYVFGGSELVVVNETTWDRERTVPLD